MGKLLVKLTLLATGLMACGASFAVPLAGLGLQYHYIAPESFVPMMDGSTPACPMKWSGGYYINSCTTGTGQSLYAARLELPEGSQISTMYTWYYDNSATHQFTLSLSRTSRQAAIPTTATAPSYTFTVNGMIINSGVATADANYHMNYVTPTSSLVFDSWNNTSPYTFNAYNLYAYLPPNDSQVMFGGVLIGFVRQIAPAPASATYADVPTTHQFFNEVQQLSKSGITQGCGGGNFCPDAAVTRGQMAAFLSRALGLQWDLGTD